MKLRTLCLLLLCAAAIRPQEQREPAAVEGFVTSDIAAVVPGATIRLDSLARGYHRNAQTDMSGHYSIDEVQPGAYSLLAEVKGWGCIIYPHVTLDMGQHLRQDFVFARAKRYPEGCEPPPKKPPK